MSSESGVGELTFLTVRPGRDSKPFLMDATSKILPPARYSRRSLDTSACSRRVPDPSALMAMVWFTVQDPRTIRAIRKARISARRMMCGMTLR
jgi:hypothetical protein